MKNFPIEKDGQTYWFSRSLACGVIVFAKSKKDKRQYVLANKRGKGCEYNVGKWNVPGGFIDFDEDAKQCAIRECYEETGLVLDPSQVEFFDLNTEPKGKRQTMVARFVAVLTTPIEDIVLTNEHSEPDEVEEIKWIPFIGDSDPEDAKYYDWSRDQYEYLYKAMKYLNQKWIIGMCGY